MDYEKLTQAIQQSLDDIGQENTQLKARIGIYQQAVNRIDDHFEYDYDSDLDKRVVMRIIDGITKQLRASVKDGSDENN